MLEHQVSPKGNFTILKVKDGKVAAKTFSSGTLQKYNAGMYFNVQEDNVTNINELSDKLFELADDHTRLVIRDELAPGIDHTSVVKRKGINHPEGDGAFKSRNEGVQWLMLDFDKIECPDGMSLLPDPTKAIDYLISNFLPSCFHGVTYHRHLSSSAGLDGGKKIRVHLWYWLSHPVTNKHLKTWALHINSQYSFKLIDYSLFHLVQPHYTANPLFEAGTIDPCPERSALIHGDKDHVEFPHIDEYSVKPTSNQNTATYYAGSTAGLKPAHTYEEWMKLLGDHEGGNGFSEALLNATWCYVKENGADGTDKEALKQALREAIDNADQSNQSESDITKKKSDAFLDSLIEGAMAKIGTKATETKLIHGLLPYYPAGTVLSTDEAISKLRQYTHSYTESPRNMGIKAPAGLGKTMAVVAALNQIWWDALDTGVPKLTEIYVPTLQLADELEIKLEHLQAKKKKNKEEDQKEYFHENTFQVEWQPHGMPSPVKAVVIRGRERMDKYGNPYCHKNAIANALTKKGLSIFPNLCRNLQTDDKCEYYDECLYIKQFYQDCDVRIFTHAHLALNRGFLDNKLPDFVVIDETFHKNLILQKTLPANTITKSGWAKPLIDAINVGLITQVPLLKHLRDTLGEEGIYSAIEQEETAAEEKESFYLFGMDDEDQLAIIEKQKKSSSLNIILRVLRTELHTGRDICHSIEWVEPEESPPVIKLRYRESISRFKKGLNGKESHVLTIDADLCKEIHDQFFDETEYQKIEVERKCRVIQVSSTVSSNNTLFNQKDDSNKRKTEIQSLIDKLSNEGKKVLVVAPQELYTGKKTKSSKSTPPVLVTTPNPDDSAHFGGIRGIDRWKDHDAVIIVGRNDPDAAGAEGSARALYFDSIHPLDLPGKLQKEARGYRMAGLKAGVNVRYHPDPRIQQVLEQMRESESQQAVDRLRFIHGTEGRQVFLLSNLVLDIDVDSLISWTDLMAGGTKLEQAWELSEGVLPLSAKWLTEEFAGVFVSLQRAKDELTYFKEMGEILNYISIKNYNHLTKYKFKLLASVKIRTCLSQYTQEETKAKLEVLFQKTVVNIEKVTPANPTEYDASGA